MDTSFQRGFRKKTKEEKPSFLGDVATSVGGSLVGDVTGAMAGHMLAKKLGLTGLAATMLPVGAGMLTGGVAEATMRRLD